MKRIFYIILPIFLVLWWCSFSEKYIDIWFDDIWLIFSENIQNFYTQNSWFLDFKWYENNLNLSINWHDEKFTLESLISINSEISESLDKNSQSDFLLYFNDTKKRHWNLFSGSIYTQKINENYFIKLSDWLVNLWTWNYEWDFAMLLVNKLQWKWIKYDPKTKNNLLNIYRDIIFIINSISSNNIFAEIKQITYEWNKAYKIEILPTQLDYINDNLYNKIIGFTWTFIVKSMSEIELKIDDLILLSDWKQKYIKWNIWGNYWYLEIRDNPEIWKYIEFSRNSSKKQLKVDIKNIENFEQLREFWSKIQNNGRKNDNLIYDIKSYLKLSWKLIYWSNLENDSEININWSYEKTKTWNIFIKEPESYILLDQILWDDFSLNSLLWENTF